MDIIDWITEEVAPEQRNSEDLLYEHMESQSDRCLPIIYQPFDPTDGGHWRHRGAALDFVLATQAEGKRVLDLGPGDGWPSLIIAPFVSEVVGVEGAHRRVEVCRANAARLGITNATFDYVKPGDPLPYSDQSFDAVVAASSIEQTPDPRATLAELYRVLKPSGRLRMFFESLARYRGEPERETWLRVVDSETTRLMLYDRHIDEGFAVHIALTYTLAEAELVEALGSSIQDLAFEAVTIERLTQLESKRVDAGICTTQHAPAPTLIRWMTEIGFSSVQATHSGIWIAGNLFGALAPETRPATLEAIDRYLRPIVQVGVDLLAPVGLDPMLTAVK
jgi:ubiquinone/menaquinone biosynthesis C-methylase UbiE